MAFRTNGSDWIDIIRYAVCAEPVAGLETEKIYDDDLIRKRERYVIFAGVVVAF